MTRKVKSENLSEKRTTRRGGDMWKSVNRQQRTCHTEGECTTTLHIERRRANSQALLHLGVGEFDAVLDALLELRDRFLDELLLVVAQLADTAETLDAVALETCIEKR